MKALEAAMEALVLITLRSNNSIESLLSNAIFQFDFILQITQFDYLVRTAVDRPVDTGKGNLVNEARSRREIQRGTTDYRV